MTNESAVLPARSPLLPDRHPQRDLFVCDIVDAVPKADMASMEHPVFSLSTKPDMRTRRYERGENWIQIAPSRQGLATVHDRDILIYCISQCIGALNEGRKVSRHVRFKAHDLLVATNRQTSGRGYELLRDALRRLKGTEIETSIRQGGKEHLSAFGLISAFEIVRETRDGRMLDVEITLADWVFDAIENNNVLTLNRQYFFLRKPLERRLYEIARKHCGAQGQWKIGLELLRDKCGSSSTVKEFRRLLGKIIDDDGQHDHMPDYTFLIEEDVVIVRPKKETHQSALPLPLSSLRLAPDTHEDARRLAPGWDMHHLEDEWRSWVLEKAISVKDPDRHFLAFCKKRGAYKR
jgi:plasmid replication initiation protein|tara:strand:- start:4991 stop:6040 length:1050 start_codon:yes stop_codon:yes gene_type:complete